MQSDVINRKLESLRHCLARLKSKMPLTYEVLSTDYDLQDIMSVNLERTVQICVDIAAHVLSETEVPPPSTMAEGFERLAELKVIEPSLAGRMRKAVALRNILVHDYTDINWAIILAIITHDLEDFVQFAHAIDHLTNG
jgi:uncharacterized protein YutE (UPF0331/DUF86 family)